MNDFKYQEKPLNSEKEMNAFKDFDTVLKKHKAIRNSYSKAWKIALAASASLGLLAGLFVYNQKEQQLIQSDKLFKGVNKKVKKLGLYQLLSQKNSIKSLFVVEDFKKEIIKTKIFNEFLIKNKLKNCLLVSDKSSKSKIFKSTKNIPNLKVIEHEGTNIYDLLKYKNIVFTKSSIKSLEERLSK